MAITYTSDNVPQAAGVNRQITSGTLTIATNDIVTVIHLSEDHDSEGTLTISNSGTALTWNLIGSGGATANCRATAWWAKSAGNENRTVTVNNSTATTTAKSLSCRVHTGAHQTTPVPAGNVFSGTGATDVSQAITPTASGSALWMGAGDWAATNTFAAIANCTLDNTYAPTNFTGTIVRPTTQPRTDAVAFTIGETDTSGKIAWIAFEVQAAASAVSSVPANRPPRARVGMLNPGTPGNVMRAFFPQRAGVSSAALATITGTLATTNADDTSAASGTTTVVGTLAKTNANDTSAAAGTTTVLGTLARTNANDTSAASGATTVVGTLATTNANDTLAASGSAGAVSGTLATTNANDTSSAAGTTTVLGTLARTNANDSSVASGTTTVAGTLARTNADDTLSASGAAGAVTGTLAYTNASDTLSASGTVTPPAITETFGGGFPDFGTLRERKRKEPEPIEIAELPQAVIAVLPQAIKRRKTVTLDQLIGAAEQADVSLIDIEVIFQAAERKKRQQDDEEILLFY